MDKENGIRDVAASLILEDAPATEEAQVQEEAPTEDIVDEIDDGIDETGDEDTGEDTDETEDDEAEEGDEEVGDTYTFKVDGEEVTVSVDDLVQSYSIDGAARKRLQEATEARASAAEVGRQEGLQQGQAELQTRAQEVDQARQQLSELVGVVGAQLFAPSVGQPDPSLQDADPIGYLTQVNAYRDDQARIQQLQQQVVQATQAQQANSEQQMAQRKQQESLTLRQKRPDLSDPDKAQQFTEAVRAAQDHFGFTAAEIDAFPDHRGLLALEYAGRALRAETAEGLTPAQRVVKKAKGKVMAPGAVTHNRSVVKKQRVAERKQAQTTGDYRDVAKLLVQSAPKRR